MDVKDEALLKRLLATFKAEAAEHLLKISTGLVGLEKTADPEEGRTIVETIFREAHSFKGAAGSLNLGEIEAICQAIEGLFAALKRLEIVPSQAIFDTLHRAVDILGRISASPEGERRPGDRTAAREIIRELEEYLPGAAPAAHLPREEMAGRGEPRCNSAASGGRGEPRGNSAASGGRTDDTVRVSAARLDSLMLHAEELIPVKLSLGQRVSEIRELQQALQLWAKTWAFMLPSLTKLRAGQDGERSPGESGSLVPHARRVAESLEGSEQLFRSLEQRISALERLTKSDLRSLTSMMEGLLADAKRALMLPLHSLFEILPKVVRDLSHAQGKQAVLTVKGAELEIDRRILEEFKDPLIHLVRNCVDHGVEEPEERVRLGKTETGSISIAARAREGGKVEIVVADDGRGIDAGQLKVSALKAGVISQLEAGELHDADALKLAFVSGVSTSPVITDISGRGLGLAIVSEKVQKLGGTVSVDAGPGRGTTFTVVLPVTLATLRGILVRVSEHFFMIPGASAEHVLRLAVDRIRTVENRETIEVGGKTLALARMDEILGITRTQSAGPRTIQVIVLDSGDARIAFAVDEIVGEQEVLMKNLGSQLSRVKCIAGATLTGTGRVVPVLNPGDLIKAALKAPAGLRRSAEPAGESKDLKRTLLVIEDSITARTLLKNILEAAGYEVKTAVDGVDGYTLLKTESFDLVVSDIDMPRMNGLDLTARIRADKDLSELPVVLVTALGSPEDRERGVDAGANAYIVKSSFDQSNLLEVIRRLV